VIAPETVSGFRCSRGDAFLFHLPHRSFGPRVAQVTSRSGVSHAVRRRGVATDDARDVLVPEDVGQPNAELDHLGRREAIARRKETRQ
jgi:hypothetical protein